MLKADALTWALLALVLYLALAGFVWSWRNPLGNEVTFWRHLPSALTFQALPQFQEHTP